MSLKIQLSQVNPIVGDLSGNCRKILDEFKKAQEKGCDLVVFSETIISGYPAEDLWRKKYFIQACQEKLSEIREATKGSKCAILLGCPTIEKNPHKKDIIRNSAILLEQGEIKKIINKKSLPNYGVFDESRYFEAHSNLSSIEFRGLTLFILICEDMWDPKNLFLLKEQIFDATITLNASTYSDKKHEKRLEIVTNFTKTLGKPLVYVNQVGGQDAIIFDGSSFAMNSQGEAVLQMKEFEEDSAVIELEKTGELKALNPSNARMSRSASHYCASLLGLRDYISKNGFKKVLLGMSGGIDSALVATIAVDALGPQNVMLYALPSRYNAASSMEDAVACAKNLGVNLQTISIEPTFQAMESTLGDVSSLTKENLQARIRGNILMALSNNSGALLLSTGNKSEMACGYATLYGDMCGAFNPIKDLYKTEVYELARWRNENIPALSVYPHKNLIPQNILEKAPTAELRPNQKDSDSLPEYAILDRILFALIEEQKSAPEVIKMGFDEELVKKVVKLVYTNEYKRRQAMIGPKISKMSFDKDRRYPITNKFDEFYGK